MKVYCPYCNKEVEYRIEERKVEEFRGIKINTFEKVGICNKCNKDLYINELENKNNERIYEEYRKKSNIIKSDDIINLRKKYDISQRELTYILGFAKMTINRYEKGALPTKSQSDYIKLLIDNEKEFINKTKEAYKNNKITKKTYDKILAKNSNSENKIKDINDLYRTYIEEKLERDPDIYNGYQKFNIDKVENIISYIASKVKNLTITSLNKYLWYIDMLSFNKNCKSITGITYQHEQYGPTIIERIYEKISLLNDKYIREEYEYPDNITITRIESKKCKIDNITKEEKEIIDTVINILKNKKVTEISEMSHKEKAWKKTKRYEKISFEYAMDLNIVK